MNEVSSTPSSPQNSSSGRAEVIQDDEIDLAQLWATLWAGNWQIVACVFVAVLIGIFYLLVTEPTYQTDALLQVQTDASSPLEGVTSDLEQLAGKNTSPAAPEMEIMTSRAVLGETVDDLGLAIKTAPIYFPIIGKAIASHRQPSAIADKPIKDQEGSWLSRYAWAPTNIKVTQLDVPADWMGEALTLRALGAGRYILFGPNGGRILTASVGESAKGEGPNGGSVRIFVQSLEVSDPPTDFKVSRYVPLAVISNLASTVHVSEQGDDTGIVKMILEGHNKSRITNIVNSVANNYVQQNVEARSERAKKSLAFLDKQLPELKSDVEAAESALSQYQEDHDQSVNLDAEGQALLEQAVSIEDKQSQLKMKIAELRQNYTSKHPALEAARAQMSQLQQERGQLENKIGRLPDAQKDILRLRRDVEVKTQLYTALLNRAQELRVIKAGTVGNVRIIDKAVEPLKPVAPSTKVVLLLAIVLGGVLGCVFVFLRAALNRAVNDPQDIEQQLGVPVYAVVPFSSWLQRRSRKIRERHTGVEPLLARDHSEDAAVEALRSLRTSLYFAQMDTDTNVLLMSGPAPGVGKSFVSVNLAYLQQQTGQNVVVVDADMRRGRLHEFLPDKSREPGLSQLIARQNSLDECLRALGDTGITVLSTGRIPPNPSELLMHEEFPRIIDQLRERFDLVIIDTPPILAVTDAAVIAGAIPDAVSFMVVRAGQHPIRELEECLKRMSRHNRKVAGVVFNAYRRAHAAYGGGYDYYQYEYKSAH